MDPLRPRGAWHGGANRGHQVGRGRERPPPHDGTRDAPREPLAAVLEQDARQLGLVRSVHEFGGRLAARRVEAHVERLVVLEAETALRFVQLIGGHAEVEEHRARPAHAMRGGHACEVAEVGALERHAIAKRRQADTSARERLGIGVDPEQPHVGATRLQYCLSVTTHPHRPVDHPAPAPRSQDERDLVHESGYVNR